MNARKCTRVELQIPHAFRTTPGLRRLLSATSQTRTRRAHVDKNRTEGTKHEIKGAIKEGVGKVTGNIGKQVAGNIEKNAGKVQNAVGKAADKQRADDKKHR